MRSGKPRAWGRTCLTLWLLHGRSTGPFPKSVQTLSSGFIPHIFPFIATSLGLERFNGRAGVNVGSLARFSGRVAGARRNSAAPQPGLGFEPDVIAPVFIGGASISGGAGTILGGHGPSSWGSGTMACP
jgi:ABC-type xylose transport system permease subunit